MNEQASFLEQELGYGVRLEQRNKVLRNTYWLLGLSLVPTVLGAWAGGRLFHGLASERLYRNVALAILFATGMFGLLRNWLLG